MYRQVGSKPDFTLYLRTILNNTIHRMSDILINQNNVSVCCATRLSDMILPRRHGGDDHSNTKQRHIMIHIRRQYPRIIDGKNRIERKIMSVLSQSVAIQCLGYASGGEDSDKKFDTHPAIRICYLTGTAT